MREFAVGFGCPIAAVCKWQQPCLWSVLIRGLDGYSQRVLHIHVRGEDEAGTEGYDWWIVQG